MPEDKDQTPMSLLSMLPEKRDAKLDDKKTFLRYQDAPELAVIPVVINPEHEGVNVSRFRSFKHVGEAAVDHDGSPTAYKPDDTGSDKLANGYNDDGVAVGFIPDTLNSEGGFVSKTEWERKKNDQGQENYVDSRRVPYVVVPHEYLRSGGKVGDFVRLRNKVNGKETWAVVADSRKKLKEVEISIAACGQLGIEFNRVGTTKNYQRVAMEAFKGSATGRWY